jgi:hypothetical protein
MPGWGADSYGVHGDEGNAYCERGFGIEFMDKWATGDVVGIGIDFKTNEIFATHNGVYVGVVARQIPRARHLLPTLGMASLGEKVQVNFGGHSPFVFDLLEWIATQEMDRKLKEKDENADPGDKVMAIVDFRDMWPVDLPDDSQYCGEHEKEDVPARYRKYSDIGSSLTAKKKKKKIH